MNLGDTGGPPLTGLGEPSTSSSGVGFLLPDEDTEVSYALLLPAEDGTLSYAHANREHTVYQANV